MTNDQHTTATAEEQLTQIEEVRKALGLAASNMAATIGDYSHMVEAEPVLDLITPGRAWVVQGQHGPTLVSTNLAAWDVDSDSAPLFERVADPANDEELLADLGSDLRICWPNDSFRIYRTHGGLRVLCTSRPFHLRYAEKETLQAHGYGGEAEYQGIAELIGADPRYTAGVLMQKACHLRLKPKDADHTSRVAAAAPGGELRACRWIGNVDGAGALPAEQLMAQLRFHDRETGACDSGALF